MNKLKLALIGCGRISGNHIKAILDNYCDIGLVAVCDIVESKAGFKAIEYLSRARERYVLITWPKVYSDYKQMLKKEDIDVCSICTESGYHAEIALYCLNHNKHVIVEKPMAMSISDANEMIQTAKQNNLKLAVCHQNRFNLPIQKLKRAVDEGRFGRIFAGTARVLWNRNKAYYDKADWRGTWELDGGCLINQCTHNIDLLQWMIGSEIKSVYGQTANYSHPYIQTEDYGSIIIKFANGAIGNVEGTVNVYPKNLEETLTILGEKGTAVIGGLALNKILVWDFEDKLDSLEQVKKEYDLDINNIYGDGHTPLYEDFIREIRNDSTPLIDGNEGKKSLSIILMAYKSQKESRAINYSEDLDIDSKDFEGMLWEEAV
ncbi:MAG: Gfo/Idh/MocA family oxidoreductase [Candidatus Marinimicrobia bacterium]|nr:Gfo/Idh/MocA family oxidoreductase [Candidatus Neomarinimicrobiota bacterium]